MSSLPPLGPDTSLSTEERGTIVDHLDATLTIFEKNAGRLTVDEIKIKSMLAVLRREIRHTAKTNSLPPKAV